MQPIQMTVTGTTGVSAPVRLDYLQNPFSVSVACLVGAAAVTYSIQHTYNFSTVFGLPTWDGSTVVTWINNLQINGATANAEAAYSEPVAAVRLNVTGGVATSTVTMIVAQATNAP
jgi:uncharacterized protein YbbC (DUF1343 family)